MRTTLISSLICCFAISACSPVISKHGFVTYDENPVTASVGTDTKTSLLSKYGNPSQTGTFDDQVWYYMTATQKQKAFYKPKTTERLVVAISFDDGDKVSEVRNYTLADGRVINYDKHKTPTRGREVTFLEQLFGSIGRSPIQLPGQDPNLPTAAGGPRSQ